MSLETLTGAQVTATGPLTWWSRIKVTGRVWTTIQGTAPTGQRVRMSVRMGNVELAASSIEGLVDRFQRSTLATWDEVQERVHLCVILTRHWDITIGQHGTTLPQIKVIRRLGRGPVKGWDWCYLRSRPARVSVATTTHDMT